MSREGNFQGGRVVALGEKRKRWSFTRHGRLASGSEKSPSPPRAPKRVRQVREVLFS